MTNEAFARVRIDTLLAAQGWDTQGKNAVRFEVMLPDGKRADYVLCDRHGRSLAVIEAKRCVVSPGDAATQARQYAESCACPSCSCRIQSSLWSTFGKRQFLERATTSAGQYSINIEDLSSIPVLVPPLPSQPVFVERIAEVASFRKVQASASAKAKATFDALLAWAFTAG